MGVLLQGFFKLPPNNALPSPADGTAGVQWWWDHIAEQARAFSLAGFSAIWLPPILKTSSGATAGADGYGPFDDYDIGSKKQKGSIPTRFGTREQLQRCAAVLRANGLDIYLDMVEHHRVGDGGQPPQAFVFRYLGANGTPGMGRFPKNPSNFLPQVPRDPNLGGPPSDDLPFGRELAPINAKPPHYVFDGLIAASDWLTRAIDAQGYRLDDVKGLSTDFLLPYLNSKAMAGKFAVGEFFDGNRLLVNQWIFNQRGMQGRPSAFDFPLKFLLTSMCNNPGRFNMADLDHAGLTGISPLNAVTFVENHDTDLQNSQKIVNNKLLGYAYILTSEGYPSVFYKDYSTDPDCYKLQPRIDNLIWIHEMLASGTTQQRWKDFDVFAYEREGGSRLLVALNNDPNGPHTIRVATGFGANVHLKDYTGHGGDVFTDGGGAATVQVPANVNGLGYVCYSPVGQDRQLPTRGQATTQDFEGAADLDILPAINGKTVSVSRIWCDADTPVTAILTLDRTGWTAASQIEVILEFPDQTQKTVTITSGSPANSALKTTTTTEGFYTLQLTASGMPAGNLTPAYKVSVTYTAPQTFLAAKSAALPSVAGVWGPAFQLANVAIHAHLLPTGKVLYWGRRTTPGDTTFASLNEHFCKTHLWDPATGLSVQTSNSPTLFVGGGGVNLFCSGHSFLPDGRLLVVGGHLFDSEGVNQSCIYDPATDTWTAQPTMNDGRWYPSALTLPSGDALALSGSFFQGRPQPPPDNPNPPTGLTPSPNPNPQIWNGKGWQGTMNFVGLPLFPRLHIEPKQGRVFMSGPQGESFFLDTTGNGNWIPGPTRDGALRDYAPSVMYESGKVLFIGGGLDKNLLPTNLAETIDLNQANPTWQPTSPMHFARRQHNATILPDGTVLVTGGTQGKLGNASWRAFDNLDAGAPVHQAELWDPASGQWTLLPAEDTDRCYHSIALLLPDGRVLSAGGGEYAPNDPKHPNESNPPADSHRDAQLYSPPYLMKGPRPQILVAPSAITYGQGFDVTVAATDVIVKVSWIRLSSVTHSNNQNQLLNFLAFDQAAGKVTIQAPANANVAPPGHYMLFVLNRLGVPSIAHIASISAQVKAQAAHNQAFALAKGDAAPGHIVDTVAVDRQIARDAGKPPVVIGITPTCPYGIAACWGGAYDALQRLSGIDKVRPVPDSVNSVAFVYLKDDTLPDLDQWRQEFAEVANRSYELRGIEMTLEGTVTETNGLLTLAGNAERPEVLLAPLQAPDKVQWNIHTRENWPMSPAEETAYERLSAKLAESPAGITVDVVGPLKENGNDSYLEVREFTIKV